MTNWEETLQRPKTSFRDYMLNLAVEPLQDKVEDVDQEKGVWVTLLNRPPLRPGLGLAAEMEINKGSLASSNSRAEEIKSINTSF